MFKYSLELFLFMCINQMSFYVLSKRNLFDWNLAGKIMFADLYQIEKGVQVIIVIGCKAEIVCFDIAGKQLVRTIHKNNSNTKYQIFQVERLEDTLYILSQTEIYLLDLKDIVSLCKNSKNFQLIALSLQPPEQQRYHIHQLTNKQIKIITIQNHCYIKLAGRINNKICFKLLALQHSSKRRVQLEYEFQKQFDYQFKASLESLSRDIIIYQVSVNKFKPIKLFSLQLSTSSYNNCDKLGTDEVLIQHEIVQFNQRMTIVSIQRISYSIICLIGSTHFQINYSSLVIVYNLKQKYTMNTINIKDTLIINAHTFGNNHSTDYKYGDDTIFIDLIGQTQHKTNNLTQIYPFCHLQTQSQPIQGVVVKSHSKSVFYQSNINPLKLGLYSKVNKKVLYFMLLKPFLSASNPKFYQQIIDFL